MVRWLIFLPTAVVGALLPFYTRAGEFSFQGTGYLSGESAYSAANGVSDDGQVVAVNSTRRAARWTKADGLVELPNLAGSKGTSIAWDVSGDGLTIVGSSFDVGLSSPVATSWTAAGVNPLQAQASVAYGASADASSIVGLLASGDIEEWVAMRWIPTALPIAGLFATAVSDDGSVVVGQTMSGTPFRWTQETGIQALSELEGVAAGISPDGKVIVGVQSGSAFRWTEASGVVPISSELSTAYAASNDGEIIVGYTGQVIGGLLIVRDAQFWINGSVKLHLSDALQRNGIGLMSDWTATNALDVSADGRTIVGEGKNSDGTREGWIATIPLLGDASFDDIIDGADYTLWADHYLSTDATFAKGDFNFDGVTDGADYTIWADHYAPTVALAATIPEPSTAALATLGAVGLLGWGVRRRLVRQA